MSLPSFGHEKAVARPVTGVKTGAAEFGGDVAFRVISAMLPEKRVLGLVDASRKVVRTPEVGVEFLHEPAVGATDLLRARTRLKAKDLISLLLGHFAGSRWAAPRCCITLGVFTPSGMPAVKIRCQ